MERSTTHSDLNVAQEFNSLNLPLWKRLSQNRVAFFAHHETLFLWLLGSICLICGLGFLLILVMWLAHQVATMEYLVTALHYLAEITSYCGNRVGKRNYELNNFNSYRQVAPTRAFLFAGMFRQPASGACPRSPVVYNRAWSCAEAWGRHPGCQSHFAF